MHEVIVAKVRYLGWIRKFTNRPAGRPQPHEATMTTTTMPQIPTERDSFDAAAFIMFAQWLREQGLTALDDLLWMVWQRMAVTSEEAAKTQREFELKLREFTMAFERNVHFLDLGRIAPDADGIIVDGKRYRRLKQATMCDVLTMAGRVKVPRHLYRERGGHGGKTVDPLLMSIGAVYKTTPAAAAIICDAVASAPVKEAVKNIASQKTMKLSASHASRVVESVGAIVEEHRDDIDERIRVEELRSGRLPAESEVAYIAVSLDGVFIRMKNAPNTPGASKDSPDPKGHREASSATVCLYDTAGKRLYTISLARMPEPKKVSLQWQLESELAYIIERYPGAQLVAVADAAAENWRIIKDIEQNLGVTFDKAVDYFHAAEHLSTGLKLGGLEEQQIKEYRKKLRDDFDGPSLALQTLMQIRDTDAYEAMSSKQKADFEAQITYFSNNLEQMPYAAWMQEHKPIGSGVQEAACKSLVVWRMKGSGMSWLHSGGQAVLTFRAYSKSERSELLWPVLAPKLCRSFEVDPSNKRQKPSWVRRAA